ncbi:MAG: helix-turn-helix domain-containing protein [Rhodothermaceae bacterium]|nr:helix-turn-helix domain-containing protein [Rhodothermaceae bacterium]
MKPELINTSGKKIYIRYMTSLRCKMAARSEMQKLGIEYSVSIFGAIQFTDECTQEQFDMLNKNLRKHGLALLDERQSSIIDKIINEIIEVIHYSDELPRYKYAELLHENIGNGETSFLQLFSDVQGISVLHFIILQKIERIKEMLLYEDFTLSDIAQKLYYKNEQSMTAQFKKFTGLYPQYFIDLKAHRERIRKRTKDPDNKTVAADTTNVKQ